MIDSTYMVASNPNTMRDQGQCRNAEYHFVPKTDQYGSSMANTFNANKSVQSQVGKTFMKNKDGYSFGGKTKFGNMYHHTSAYTGFVDPAGASCASNKRFSKSIDEGTASIYNREYNQKVNDYTKNISQEIFSPGLTKPVNTDYKNSKKLAGQRRSICYDSHGQIKYKKYDPLRPNAFQMNKDANKVHSPSRTVKSAKSLSKKIQKEKL